MIAIDGALYEWTGHASDACGAAVGDPAATTAASRLGRGLFMTAVVAQLRCADGVRLTAEALFAREGSEGWSSAWLAVRPGAVRLDRA